MIQAIRNLLARRNPHTGLAPTSDAGYALVTVMGFGGVIVLSLLLLGSYTVQAMKGSRHAQDSSSAVEAAQAGVDDLVARLQANPALVADGTTTPSTGWVPIRGATDVAGAPCTDGALTASTCPQFSYQATRSGNIITVTSTGKSLGVQRSVRVSLKQPAFSDYLYYSDIEAADPADKSLYPTGAPSGCDAVALNGATTRPANCVVPTWRTGDTTDGSRVHTSDVFNAVGTPAFNSRVTAANAACAADASKCVLGGSPTFQQGQATYADDLTMPANGLSDIAGHATTVYGGCTYYGPTRIQFEGAKMRVFSPQTPADNLGSQGCGGGVSPELLNTPINVVVTTLNRTGICSLLGGLTGLLCSLTYALNSVVRLPLSQVLSGGLLSGTGLIQALGPLVAVGNVVNVRPNMALYVQDNAVGDAIPDPSTIGCLLNTTLGMYGTADTNLTAGLLDNLGSPLDGCRKGKLFVSGSLDGKVTAGVAGDILIMSNTTYAGSDDRLGLVATGPVEVYNSLQCTLAASTCLSVQPLGDTLTSALGALRTAGTGDLTSLLQQVPGYGQNIEVDADVISLQHRFGVQLPVLSLNVAASVLNQLVNLRISPPTLTLKGSVAQHYRGLVAADLVSLGVNALGVNVASADVDYGYKWKLVADKNLSADPPLYLPKPGASPWQQTSFAEVPAGH